jgi:hypothetical protein
MTSGNAERPPPEEAGCDDSVELCPLPPQLGRAGGAAPGAVAGPTRPAAQQARRSHGKPVARSQSNE